MDKRPEIRVLGTKRSGHHLVMNWILSALPEGTAVRDNLGKAPENFSTNSRQKKLCRLAGFEWVPDVANAPAFLYGFEETPVRDIKKLGQLGKQFGFGKAAFRSIVVARDPGNQFASYLQLFRNHPHMKSRFRPSFHKHWNDYLKSGFFIVHYELFISNPDYRDALSRKLGIPYGNDDVLSNLPKTGSSWDPKSIDATSMKVTERWRAMEGDDTWRQWMQKPKVVSQSRRHWPGNYEEQTAGFIAPPSRVHFNWNGELGCGLLFWIPQARNLADRYRKLNPEVRITASDLGAFQCLYDDFVDDYIAVERKGVRSRGQKDPSKDSAAINRIRDDVKKSGGLCIFGGGVSWWTSRYTLRLRPYQYQPTSVEAPRILLHVRNLKKGRCRNFSPKLAKELADHFLEQGYQVACIGTSTSARWVEGTEDLRDIPLPDVINALVSAKLFISSSSGPVHLAQAVGEVPMIVWGNRSTQGFMENRTWFGNDVRFYLAGQRYGGFQEPWRVSKDWILKNAADVLTVADG